LGAAILANAKICKVAPATTRCPLLSRLPNLLANWLVAFRSFFTFHSRSKMILTEEESTLASKLLLQGNLGRKVEQRLQDALQGASDSETIFTQASYCREVLYVLDKVSQTYSKKSSKTWEVNCVIVHNPHYFARVRKWLG
jgi:hypothetical protein